MIIYTDGSAKNNGRANSSGGFGVVVYNSSGEIVDAYQHFESNTTNNIQEIKAILWTLIHYGKNKEIPIVYSDSSYCVSTFNEWMYGWARRGWLKSDQRSPENLELIQAYYNLLQKGYKIDLRKIRGHSGHKGNELADALATGKKRAEDIVNIMDTIMIRKVLLEGMEED